MYSTVQYSTVRYSTYIHYSVYAGATQSVSDVPFDVSRIRSAGKMRWRKWIGEIDVGPTAQDVNHWVPNDPSRWTDAFMLDSGATMVVTPESPYFYQDALNDKIVHEILIPQMLCLWFLNQE